MTTGATPPRRTQAAAEARLAATKGGTSTQTGHRVVNVNMRLANGRGRQDPQGGRPGGGRPVIQRGRRTGHLRGGGVPRTTGGGGVEDSPLLQHNRSLSVPEGGGPLHGRRQGPAGIQPCQGASVFEGGIRRLPSQQRWDAPGRGSPG